VTWGSFTRAKDVPRPLRSNCYTVRHDGHFIGYEPPVCGSDKEASDKAKRLVDGHDVELWSGDRFVIRLESKLNPP
jgi:hypothetical protein